MESVQNIMSRKFQPGLSVSSYDPVAYQQMRADTINAMAGELTGYECKKCRNRGFVAAVGESGNLISRECDCMPMRKCIWQMERSGLKNIIRDMTFEAFTVKEPWQNTLKEGAKEYANDPKGWLMMGGQPGCGKTHLCVAVCRELLLRGESLFYMPWREHISQLKSLPFDSPVRTELMEKCKNTPWLYIDDLYKTGRDGEGRAQPTATDISLAFEILNHRYVNRMPTILSSERTPQELVAIDEATGSRIVELCGRYIYSIGKSKDKNYRLRSVVDL